MKQLWDALIVALIDVQDEVEELIPELPQSKHFNSRATSLRKKWALAQKLVNDFSELIMPVESIPVKSPFDHVDFINAWQMWKEYLTEQHGIVMRSRMEVISLKRLAEITNSDPKKAIKILELAMSGGWRNFFYGSVGETKDTAKSLETVTYE